MIYSKEYNKEYQTISVSEIGLGNIVFDDEQMCYYVFLGMGTARMNALKVIDPIKKEYKILDIIQREVYNPMFRDVIEVKILVQNFSREEIDQQRIMHWINNLTTI